MKKTELLLLFFGIYSSLFVVKAQTSKTDSLKTLLQNHSAEDTTKVNLLNELAYKIYPINIDSTLLFATQAGELADKLKFSKGKANSLRNIGTYYLVKSNYPGSLEYYQKSLKIDEESRNTDGISNGLFNIGTVFIYQGNYSKALEYFQKSLKMYEESGNKQGISNCYNNIGAIYWYQKDYSKALEYYQKSLKMYEDLNNLRGISIAYVNIGEIYEKQNDYEKALKYYQKSLKIREELNDIRGISYCSRNIGVIYKIKDEHQKALEYFQKSLKISLEIDDKSMEANNYKELGLLYLKQNKTKEALNYGKKAYRIAKEIGSIELVKESSEIVSKSGMALGLYKNAYEYHVIFKTMSDSLHNTENTKKITELELQYQYEAEKQAAELKHKQKQAISNADLKKQKIVNTFYFIGIILFVVLLLIALWIIKQRKKGIRVLQMQKLAIEKINTELNEQNEEISVQRDQLFRQNESINESISYAKRIQIAVMPRQDVVDEIFPENFILLRPKDKVSGDFYWVKQINQYKIALAADCTGHGVPGAILSMLGISFINEIVHKREITNPADILADLRRQLKQTLKQTGKTGEADDGMDVSLVALDTKTKIVQFAGANNPFYYVQNGQLNEIRGDRMPIGFYPNEKPEFSNYEIQLSTNDIFYLFSDGFTDQLGGKKGLKYRAANFKKILLENYQKPMIIQKELLEQDLKNWMNGYGQTDDILVMGIRI